jgi:predicted Zn-dependent protease
VTDGGGYYINLGANDRLELKNTSGNYDQITSSGDVSSGSTADHQMAGIYFDANAQANVTGDNNAITLATGNSLGAYGSSNSISSGANDLVMIGNTTSGVDVITAINQLGGATTANGQPTGVYLNSGAKAYIDGSNSTISESSSNEVTLTAGGDTVNANGDSNLNNVYGARNITNVIGTKNITNNSGAGDQTNVSGTEAVTNNYGDSDNTSAAGYKDSTNNFGANEHTQSTGTYDATVNAVASDTNNTNGIASNRTINDEKLLGSDWITYEAPPPVPTYQTGVTWQELVGSISAMLDNFYNSLFGFGFGAGLAGTPATAAGDVGKDLAAIASGTWSGASQLSATNARSQLQALQAVIASGAQSVLTGSRWDTPVITWSLATAGADVSSGLDAQAAAATQAAFATWSRVSGLTFQQVADSAQSDIRVGYGNFDTATTGIVGNTRVESPGPITRGALVQIEDVAQTPLVADAAGTLTYAGTEVTLEQVLLHEIGHALGLADNADAASIESYALNSGNRTLDSTDVAAIRALYAAPASGVAAAPEAAQLVQAMAVFAPMGAAQAGVAAANDPLVPPALLGAQPSRLMAIQ